jgi:hypothetical protein
VVLAALPPAQWFRVVLNNRNFAPLATLGYDIVQKLEAAGWHLRSAPTPNPESPAAATYVGRRKGLDVRLLEINDNRALGQSSASISARVVSPVTRVPLLTPHCC